MDDKPRPMPPSEHEWVNALHGYHTRRTASPTGFQLPRVLKTAEALAEQAGGVDEVEKLRWVCLRMQELLDDANAEHLRLLNRLPSPVLLSMSEAEAREV